jgi:hypothetical protein
MKKKKGVDPSIHGLAQSTSHLDLGLGWIRTQLYNYNLGFKTRRLKIVHVVLFIH